MKKIKFLIVCLVLSLFCLVGCKGEQTEDIIILYTNDVHCEIEGSIGYAGLAAYKKEMEAATPYVTLVDCGDAVQGNVIGTISKGEYIVDIMNEVGYDITVLGNHEFDYGMDQLSLLIDKAKSTYLSANLCYIGDGEDKFSKVKPYEIIEYGDVSVAYIGVSTPHSVVTSNPDSFKDDDGEFIYSFSSSTKEEFYSVIQDNVDECLEKGADYVVACAHLGDTMVNSPFSSTELIENTTGIDVVLDAHEHNVIEENTVYNKEGEEVILSSTGTKLSHIGHLTIDTEGNISTKLINNYDKKDEAVSAYIKQVISKYEAKINEVIAHTDTLITGFKDGVRLVRTRETNIGNLCADAYRVLTGSDIGIVNGGAIRSDLPLGDITYADAMAVHPYGNMLCVIEATGQEILDALEFSCRLTQDIYQQDGAAVGENGGFLSVSGMKYTINTAIKSSIMVDENNMYVGVGNTRRISDVYVLNKENQYEPLDPNKIYILAAQGFTLKSAGDGYTMFMDNKILVDEVMTDYDVLISYLKLLKTDFEKYKDIEGRITIK